MSNQIVRIPSKLYFDIWSKGESFPSLNGDSLLAVYTVLRANKNSQIKYYSYTAKNNKFIGGYSLLRKQTNLSLSVLKKYVPVLIEMGLCFFDRNGDFVLLGGEKLKELYNSYKLVPITLGNTLTKTKYNCYSIRVMSSERQQKRMIDKKKHRSELLLQSQNPKNLKQLKAAKRVKDKNIEITDKAILSNQGFAYLKDNTQNNKSKGHYWKSRLVSNGIIKSSRRFEIIQKMSYNEYCIIKKYHGIPPNYTYIRGGMAKELPATLATTDLVNSMSVKSEYVKPTDIKQINTEYTKLEYLQFDMIGFWISMQ